MKIRRPTLVAGLLLALCAHASWAQEVRQYRAGDAVDPQDVADILGPTPAPAIKMRSLRLLDGPAAPAGTARARPKALSLPLRFSFDSAQILDSARPQLDALALGIRLLPEKQAVVIEGHTDAAGGERYNEDLSQRRARAVQQYLVSVHGIDAQRLRVEAKGEHAPLHGLDPYAAENRRVQFRGE
jgi:outer membrane protein OmpA-like peptidoglycan-associated protein